MLIFTVKICLQFILRPKTIMCEVDPEKYVSKSIGNFKLKQLKSVDIFDNFHHRLHGH